MISCCRAATGRSNPGNDLVWRKLGVKLAPVSSDSVIRVNRQLHGGLEVVAINGEGPASRAGIRSGDILVGLHNWETLSMNDVNFVLSHPELPTFQPLSFHIRAHGPGAARVVPAG